MELIRASVVTNCTEDDYFRVKVKAPGVWDEESCLIPSLNCIYLEKDDEVVVGMDSMMNPIILGKLFDHIQKDNDPVNDKHVLFQAKKDDVWIVGTLTEEGVEITTSDEQRITITTEGFSGETKDGTTYDVGESIEVETKDTSYKGEKFTAEFEKDVEVKSKAKITVQGKGIVIKAEQGSSIEIDGETKIKFKTATQASAFCNLPNCLFSGATHTIDTVNTPA